MITGLFLVLGMLLIRPTHWLQGKGGALSPFGWSQAVVDFAIGFYSGLVVLGSGFFMLAALVLFSGYDLTALCSDVEPYRLGRRSDAEF